MMSVDEILEDATMQRLIARAVSLGYVIKTASPDHLPTVLEPADGYAPRLKRGKDGAWMVVVETVGVFNADGFEHVMDGYRRAQAMLDEVEGATRILEHH